MRQTSRLQRIFIKRLKPLLARLAERYGRPVLWLYAFIFLLAATGLLAAVYFLLGWLMLQSPNAVLVLTGVLVALIFFLNRRRK
ncbi:MULTISPECIES: hypothetical protein [Sulfurimonas]|uniref:Uncharacterized protein n=1 Tax=Sulfurimonas diazotrophicus TaxID=3131939 RepID=A0ABZ3H813_9BACT